jgi:hypothetical protein
VAIGKTRTQRACVHALLCCIALFAADDDGAKLCFPADPHPSSSPLFFRSGLSVAIVALWVLSLIVRGIASVLGFGRASSEPKPAKRSSAKTAAPAAAAASGSGAAAGGSGAAAAAAVAGKKKADLKTLIRESQAARKTKHARDDTWALDHPLLLGSLPGHTDIVNSVAWSANGRALVTACDDLALRIFDTHDVAAAKDAKCRCGARW